MTDAPLVLSEGVIIDYNRACNQYLVNVEGTTLTCVHATSQIASLLGLNLGSILEVKTKVVVLRSTYQTISKNFIIGTIPNGVSAPFQNVKKTGIDPTHAFKDGKGEQDIKTAKNAPFYGGTPISANVFPGEYSLQNVEGVGLDILHTMSRLRASQLAAVECYLMDDFVRIISNAFEHITAFGNYKIYNEQGNLNVVWEGTSNEFEAFGKESKSENKDVAPVNGYVDIKEEEEAFKENGRWRFSSYIGKLGNFINMFIHEPRKGLEDLINKGRCRVHFNEDGSILFQSVSDIIFEKVVAIPVPVEIKRWEEEVQNTDDNGPLSAYEVSNIDDLSYQLRDYAKWFANYYSMAEFIKNKRFKIPTEQEANEITGNIGNKDRPEDSNLEVMKTTYSTIRIFKNGAIMLYDAFGNCYHSTAYGIQISSNRSIDLTAAGNINLKAGGSITSLSNKHTEITAGNGSLSLFAQTLLQAYAEKGPVNIQSNATPETIKKIQEGDTENQIEEDPRLENWEEQIAINIQTLGTQGSSEDSKKKPTISVKSDAGDIYMDASKGQFVLSAMLTFIKSLGGIMLDKIASFGTDVIHLFKPLYTHMIQYADNLVLKEGSRTPENPTMYVPEPREDISVIRCKDGEDKDDKFEDVYDKALGESLSDYSEDAPELSTTFKFREDYDVDDLYPQNGYYMESMSEQTARLFPEEKDMKYKQEDLTNKFTSKTGYPFPGDTEVWQAQPKNRSKSLNEPLPNQPNAYKALRTAKDLKPKKEALKIWTVE